MGFSLRNLFQRARGCIDRVIPSAEQLSAKGCARELFDLAVESQSPDVRSLGADFCRNCLTRAGYDAGSDRPYKRVLGLKGGKAEFDSLFPRS